MRTRATRRVVVRYTWDRLKVSFWFTPAVMALAAILLAKVMFMVDARIPDEMLETSNFILSGTPDQLRSLLIGIATTTLATAGVVFTLLTLPLSTVAAQYGSRLLRVFLGDRTTQFVLGMFVATFVYCLAVATSIPPAEVQPDAPQVTATVGVYMMMVTFATLILLVQHISTMLQAPNIAASAGAKLMEVVRMEIPEAVTSDDVNSQTDKIVPEPITAQLPGLETEGSPVRMTQAGYIQYVDPVIILTLAKEKDLVIRLLHKPGHFVQSGAVVAQIYPAGRVDEELDRQIRHAFRIGNTRTPTQDIEYAVNQLVEMAVRAMSPAINDPFTAMTCLDYLAEGLALFIRQGEKGSHYYDLKGNLRLVFEPVTFQELLNAAFDMLRHASCDNRSVLLHMLEAIEVINQEAVGPEARQLLAQHAHLIQEESLVGHLIENDRLNIQRRAEALVRKLSSKERE